LFFVQAKSDGSADVLSSARELIDRAKRQLDDEPLEPVNEQYLARRVNRHRQAMRPEEPTDMGFEVIS